MLAVSGTPASPESSELPNWSRPRRWLVLPLLVVAAVALFLALYRPGHPAKATPKALAMGWRPVTSFSGHGSTQTESFSIETGQWRIKWVTRPRNQAAEIQGRTRTTPSETQAHPAPASGASSNVRQVSPANKFRLVVHSLVSGRFVSVAADHEGPGSGVAYLAEEPRQFFFVIDSSGLDWTVQVEEGVEGQEEIRKNPPR